VTRKKNMFFPKIQIIQFKKYNMCTMKIKSLIGNFAIDFSKDILFCNTLYKLLSLLLFLKKYTIYA
jgi:hypothetical protein